jgi:hypothetical protein
MEVRRIFRLMLAVLVFTATLHLLAQQDEGPLLRPKKQTAKAEQQKQERERVARAEAAKLTWTDPATRLMWVWKDNGTDVNWRQATDYCRNLRLAGNSDWRLPTIDELQGIYDPNANVDGSHVKGELQLSNWWFWSSSQGNARWEAWAFYFHSGERVSGLLDAGGIKRALCVRRSGE